MDINKNTKNSKKGGGLFNTKSNSSGFASKKGPFQSNKVGINNKRSAFDSGKGAFNRSGGVFSGKKSRIRHFLPPQVQNVLCVLLVFFLSLKYYASIMSFNGISKISMLITLGISTVIILNNIKKYKVLHYVVFVIFAAQFVLTRNFTLLYAYYIALGLYNMKFRFLMKMFLFSNAVLFSVMMVFNITGYMPSEFIHGRNDFGFKNPNAAFLAMFLIWASFAYLAYDKMNKFDTIILFVMGLIMFSQTGTRTGLITIILAGLIIYLYKTRKFLPEWLLKWGSILFPIGLTLFSLIITYLLYDSYILNDVLSHRPLYWNKYFTDPRAGLNLIGYAANIRETLFMPRMPFDSGYLWALFSHGLVCYTIVLGLITYTLKCLYEQQKRAEIVLMLGLLVYCFAESIMLDISNNITLVLMVYAVFNIRGREVLR